MESRLYIKVPYRERQRKPRELGRWYHQTTVDPLMSLMDIALRTGVPLVDIEDLVRGTVRETVAARLGVPMLPLEEFIRHGQSNSKVAHRMGMSMASAEELARSLGPEGAIGLVLGLLLGSSGVKRRNAATAG